MKKKAIIYGLCLSLTFSLVGCGGQQAQEPKPEDQQNEPVTSTTPQIGSDKQIKEQINSITAENAEATGLCGADLTWYYKDNILVIKGTGAITEYERKSAPWYDYVGKISRIIVDDGCTELCDNLFRGYTSLASVILPDSITEINDSLFESDTQLVSVQFGSNIKSIGESAFSGCTNLKNISLPEGLTSIKAYAFNGCDSLEELVIPEGITTMEHITPYCMNLVSLTIPSTVTEIYFESFRGCQSLTNLTVNTPEFIFEDGVLFDKDKTKLIWCVPNKSGQYSIPDGVTRIIAGAFSGCQLIDIKIPDTVQKIGADAFENCPNLHTITFLGNAPNAIEDPLGIRANQNLTIYYSGDGFDKFIREFEDYSNINWVKQ